MGNLTHTVSGDIASFRTPSRVPIESLKFHFLPKQASGTSTPANPIPIEGWTGLNGWKASKNLLPNNIVAGVEHSQGLTFVQNADGSITITGTATNTITKLAIIKNFPNNSFPLKAGTYRPHIWATEPNDYLYMSVMYDGTSKSMWSGAKGGSYSYTVSEDTYISQIRIGITAAEGVQFNLTIYPSLEIGSTPTSFENCKGEQIPITFPSNGKNRFDPNCDMLQHNTYIINGDQITQTKSDDRGWTDDTNFKPFLLPKGTYYITASDEGAINLKIDGDNIIRFANGKGSFTLNQDGSVKFKHSAPSYPVTYTIQIECGNESTYYEPYSSDNTFYGGYVDPVAGEIVAEWAKYTCTGEEAITKWVLYGSSQNIAAKLPHNLCYANYIDGGKNAFCNIENQVSNIQMYYGNTDHGICVSNSGFVTIQVDGITTLEAMSEWLADNKPIIVYKLATPIHIPILAEDMKAFLDHNNFWSNANDVTEVTYPVTESRDILATRKKVIAFDHAHHKKIKWNQWAPAINSNNWQAHTSSISDANIADGIATLTTIGETDQQYRSALVSVASYNFWIIGHKYYLRQDVYLDQNGYSISVFGNEWGKQSYVSANTWTTITDIHETKTTSRNIFGLYPQGSLSIGTVRKVKNIMLFDLTQMFGLGNEPTTVAEFERICAINGIDLTTYQPYDEGSDRWLIIP